MRQTSRRGLIGELRRELALFASLCLLILTLPIVQPLANAHAASEPTGIICTLSDHDGGVADFDGSHFPADGPEECPCAAACALQIVFAKLAVSHETVENRPALADCVSWRHRDSSPLAEAAACHRPPGRAPPLSI